MKLKPCPFCGSNAAIKEYEDKKYKVVCVNFLCPCESFPYRTEKEAADWWNKRSKEEDDGRSE